jgi:glycerophosphoryl diester phosphodiesterase
MLHGSARALDRDDVDRIHGAGLLVCSYTTDDELGWAGGAVLGIDAMCTNDPVGMLRARNRGSLRQQTAKPC